MEFNGEKCLQRLKASGFRPSSPFQAIVAVTHSVLLSAGLVGVYEQPSTVKGFAPSLTEIPARNFFPPSWLHDSSSAVLMYKHRSSPGKYFTIAIMCFEDFASVTFTQRGGESSHFELRFQDYLVLPWNETTGDISEKYTNLEDLQSLLYSILIKYLPQLNIPTRANTTPAPQLTPTPSIPSAIQSTVPSSIMVPNPFAPPVVPLNATASTASGRSNLIDPSPYGSVGAADLDPFSNIRQPFHPMPNVARPEGGSLVGPDHPMFGFDPNYDDRQDWGPGFGSGGEFLPGFAAPQPRFDPYGPITGPNSDVNVGDVGMDSRGRLTGPGRGFPMRGGRGGRMGRGPPNHTFPGEPNPDHFRPPGW